VCSYSRSVNDRAPAVIERAAPAPILVPNTCSVLEAVALSGVAQCHIPELVLAPSRRGNETAKLRAIPLHQVPAITFARHTLTRPPALWQDLSPGIGAQPPIRETQEHAAVPASV